MYAAKWGKSFPDRGNRQCKGPEVGKKTSREAYKTGLAPHGGLTIGHTVNEVLGRKPYRVLGSFCELEATG